jgi:nanoRNase/pAp phosphatase (c-di-AMP/oligoRNAs hydrolase)
MPNGFDIARSKESLDTVLRLCGRKGRVLILMQDNPDPDAIASAVALRELIHEGLRKRAVIGYGGVIGRAENRAMIDVLHLHARRVDTAGLAKFRTICLVDTQPVAGNNALLTRRKADVVIDHHLRAKRQTWTAEFCDIRPDYGATATILYEYLLAAEARIGTTLATALLYGIQSDTQDLGREACEKDTAAYQGLLPHADLQKLARIRRAPVPSEYFRHLLQGLANCDVAGRAVICKMPEGGNPDMMAEVADLLLRLEGMRSSVCYGLVDDTIHVSARAVDARSNVARRMKRIVSRIGTGGGHRTMAGGQIPSNGDPEKRLALVRQRILKAFAPNQEPRSLFVE